MTKILALDSSSDACSVALLRDGKINTLFELAAKSHTQRLLPMVDEILQAESIALSDLDAIAFGRGPGSFTGLRICMGIVQGLAFGAELPVIPVSTLQAIAREYQDENTNNTAPIAVALDARMQEVYWGFFSPQATLLEPEAVIKPADLLATSSLAASSNRVVALGSGWQYSEFSELQFLAQKRDVHASAGAIARIAEELWQQGKAISIDQAEPVYLRDSVTWQKRERIRAQPI